MTRVGLSSYHRMKQRAEIAEAEERRLGCEVGRLTKLITEKTVVLGITLDQLGDLSERFEVMREQRNGWRDESERRPTWRHDLSTVVGGVLLAAGLIAAIVWGIYG